MIPRIRRRRPAGRSAVESLRKMAALMLACLSISSEAFKVSSSPRRTAPRRPIAQPPVLASRPTSINSSLHYRRISTSLLSAIEATISEGSIDSAQEEYQTTNNSANVSSALHKLKRYRTNRDVETAIVRLGRKGRTDDALKLYEAVWTLDRLKQQYRSKRQKQKQQQSQQINASEGENKSVGKEKHDKLASAKLISLQLPDGSTLSPELTTYVSKSKLRPTTRLMNGAIDACARSSPPARQSTAFDIFDSAISPLNPDGSKKAGGALSPNVFTFGSLLACCARNGDVAKSLELLEVLEGGSQYPDVMLNEVIYSTVISACERAEVPDVKLALEVLNRGVQTLSNGGGSKKTRGTMGVVGYNAAISTMARAARWRMAVQLLGEMILHSSSQGSRTIGLGAASSSPPSTLLRTNPRYTPLESIRDDMDASPLLKHVEDGVVVPRPDEVTFGTVLAACERSGEWEQLLHVARAATEYGVELDGLALTSVLHSCQQLGMADEALEYLELMKRLGDGNEEEGNEAEAKSVSKGQRQQQRRRKGARRRQPLRGPDGVAYRLAISACARSPGGHRWRDGIRLLEEMRENAKMSNNTDFAPDVVAYTAAIAGCSEAGEYTHAMSLIAEMRKEGVRPNVVTFSAVINACATAIAKLAKDEDYANGDGGSVGLEDVRMPMTRALRLLEAMKSPSSLVKPNIVTYNAAIRACAEGLNLDGAFDLLRQLKEDGLEPTIVTYGSLMTACERVGDVKAASRVFRMVKEEEESESEDDEKEGIRANEIIYGAAISCCRKAREPERVLSLLRKMISDELSPNTATFNTVIAALSDGRPNDSNVVKDSDPLWEKALAVYRVMKSKHAPSGVTPNRQTYNILIRCLASNLQPGYAESILTAMRKAGFVPDVDLYTMTVRSYERCGNPMKALGLMETMREDGYDFYDIPVLDKAFKSGVKILNRVGKGFTSQEDSLRVDGNGISQSYALGEEWMYFDDEDDYNDEYQLMDSLKY